MMFAKSLVCIFVVVAVMTGCSPASLSPNGLWLQGLQYEVEGKYAEAAKSYREAADRGYATAMTCLGRLYEDGHGVPQDYSEAVNWYRKALQSDKNESSAMAYLGNLYEVGHGVPQDYARAADWYRLDRDLTLGFDRIVAMDRCILLIIPFFVTLSGCARPAREICEGANKVTSVAAFIESFGRPDRKVDGAPPMEWWAYNRSDGSCIVPVYGNVISSARFVPK